MKTLSKIILIIIATLFLFVGIMLVIWYINPSQKLNVIVLDKSVRNNKYEEHKSFFWILNNERIIKSNGEKYDLDKDYFGFFPVSRFNETEYEVKRIRIEQVDSFSKYYDLLYYVDTYGVLYDNWYGSPISNFSLSLVDAGLKHTDYLLLKEMVNKKKLTICEFNILGTPTSELVREKFSELYGIRWKGWYGRYFSSLSTNNKEIPSWIIEKYKNTNKQWPFTKSGIIIVNLAQNIIILEDGTDLKMPKPLIRTTKTISHNFKMAEYINFTGWFELIEANDTLNIDSEMIFNTTAKGDSLLKFYSLKNINPIVLSYKNRMYYIAGDFSHSNIFFNSSYFATIGTWYGFLYKKNDEQNFNWNYYRPFIKGILNQYSKQDNK